MSDPLRRLLGSDVTRQEAVRWACVLEATSPKVGNVSPGKPFADLGYLDFVRAAEITADALGATEFPITSRMSRAVSRTVKETGTNVNLGIVLLLGPLVAADERFDSGGRSEPDWTGAIAAVLESFEPRDAAAVFETIRLASPGGMGDAEKWDVNQWDGAVQEDSCPNLIEAMGMAKGRDRIALQYASGFRDLLEEVVPVVGEAICSHGDVLAGIATAHLRLLALQPDSLIGRKNGEGVAQEVQRMAATVEATDSQQVAEFDAYLRDHDHKLNPGTTADLIAAALYLLIRRDLPCEKSR